MPEPTSCVPIPRSTVNVDANKALSSILDKTLNLANQSCVDVVPTICRTEKLMKWLETSGHFELSTALVDESAPASNETKGVRATPYTRCQGRWRKRPNHELEYLRQQVIDLEEELAVLHQPDTKLATLNTTGGLEIDNSDGRSWKCIAARQSEQADATLMENVKLRALLEGNLRVARALENAIDQHVRKVSRNLYWQSEEVEELRASTLPDELLFGLLNENIENQYSIIDSIFEASGVTHMTHSLCPKFQVQEGSRGATFHRGEVRLLPFRASSVLRSIRDSLSHGAAGGPMKNVVKLVKGSDSIQATLVDRLHLSKTHDVNYKSRMTQRHFIEADRTVVVWTAYVEIEGSVFVRLEEKGWATVEPYRFRKRSRPSKQDAGSCLRSVVHVTPIAMDFKLDEEGQEYAKQMADLVIETYHRNYGLMFQAVENLLMNDIIDGSEETGSLISSTKR